MIGTGPGSPETPAQMPGSADRPVLTRDGGSGARGATKNGTKAKSNTGTKSASKAKSNTGTKSASKAKSTAGTNHATGTNTNTKTNEANEEQNNKVNGTTAGTNHATGTASKAATTAGTNHATGTVTNEAAPPGAAPANTTQANAAPNAAHSAAPTQLGFQQGPMNQVQGAQAAPRQGVQAGTQQGPMGQNATSGVAQLGLQNLPSTSTATALPAGTIALLSMGGALYAIRRKIRK